MKDPVGLRYFLLSDEEHAVLSLLDGKITYAAVCSEMGRRFAPRALTHGQLQSLLYRFTRLGLVRGGSAPEGASAWRRAAPWLNPLFIKLPGVDPEPFLRRVYPALRWVFHPLALSLCGLLIFVAAVTAATSWGDLVSDLPSIEQLLRGSNLAFLLLALGVSKALHELGHAVACKHFGGECHEIGVAFLLFAPCMYCDTTDTWMVSNRWRRAAVGAAGMGVELVLAAACLLGWRYSQPGFVQLFCLNTVLVCSVSTLIFNANPLMRFDGYYILADVLGVPNLWGLSRHVLSKRLQSALLGVPAAIDPGW